MNIHSFVFLSIVMILANIVIIVASFANNKYYIKSLVGCFVSATSVIFMYLLSILADTYFINSLFSSLYFISVDFVLLFLAAYISVFTKINNGIHHRAFLYLVPLWTVVDVIILLINPFKEIAIHYYYEPNSLAHWRYAPYLPYKFHLIFCYFVVAYIFLHLLIKIINSPSIFIRRYLIVLCAFVLVVVMNAIFLFLPEGKFFDFSILFYSVVCFIIFWTNNHYSEQGMIAIAGQMVLSELSIPIVLFDFENNFTQNNNTANFLVSDYDPKQPYTLEEFMSKWKFDNNIKDINKDYSFQWEYKNEADTKIYRCDFVVLRSKRNRLIGRVFMFTDYSLDYDLLTGFRTELSYKKMFEFSEQQLKYPVGVAICDINRLSEINKNYGKDIGDGAIKALANAIIEFTPKGTYYVRLNDANLLFIIENTTIVNMRAIIDCINRRLDTFDTFPVALKMQSAITMATPENPSIPHAVSASLKSMKARKMMDANSAHSSLLDSLAQTLQESDSCTREHVKRTQILGEKLGIRLGLSDYDLSNLALLCLLHDIGKLGIPLEILNKPSKLSNEEWEVMQSHAEKGYRIAKASEELEDIADLILHHHECWNGKGYPDGLKQEAIPLLSRIIAVVDTYDAMTNDRPYRKALSNAHACKELLRCAGSQFDPYIVNQFIDMLGSMNLYEEPAEVEEEKPDNSIKPMGLESDISSENSNCSAVKYTKYTLGRQNQIISVDDNFETMTGYSKEDIENYNLTQNDLIFPEDQESYFKLVGTLLSKDHEAFIEHRLRRKDGSFRRVLCDGREYFDSVSREPRTLIIATDIALSETVKQIVDKERDSQRRSFKRWEDSVRRDALTSIYNRVAFQNDVSLKLLDNKSIIAFMMIDMDYFKSFNDTYGHQKGDELLIAFAKALESAIGDNGMAARMGGDEFSAMLMYDTNTSKETIVSDLDDIWSKVNSAIHTFEGSVTISMGVVLSSKDLNNFDALYKQADKMLYKAKEKGRNLYVIE